MSRVDQQALTLNALRERGDLGLHTFEMRSGVLGACIGNPSERIARLEKRGHRISVSEKEPLNGGALGVRYRLIFDAEQASPASCPAEPDTAGHHLDSVPLSADTSLFDATPYRRPTPGAYDCA